MSGPNTLAELGALHRARPAATAPDGEVAEWYARKARVLEHLAAQGSRAAHSQAVAALCHANALTAGVPRQGKGGRR